MIVQPQHFQKHFAPPELVFGFALAAINIRLLRSWASCCLAPFLSLCLCVSVAESKL